MAANTPTWIDPMASLFGYAAELRERLSEVRACDPLRSTVWFSEARAALWAGDPQGALDLIAQADAENISHPWLRVTRNQAEVALGRYETVLSRMEQMPEPWERAIVASVVEAARGDAGVAAKSVQDVIQAFGAGSFFKIQAIGQDRQS